MDPVHYNTFPFIEQNERDYKAKLNAKRIKCFTINIGESFYLKIKIVFHQSRSYYDEIRKKFKRYSWNNI